MKRYKKGSDNLIFKEEGYVFKLKYSLGLFSVKLNGIIYENYPEGGLKEELYFVDGLLKKNKGYYENGQLKYIGDGLQSEVLIASGGKLIDWYPIKIKGEMPIFIDSSEYYLSWQSYYMTGQLRCDGNQIDGRYKSYYENGQLKSAGDYKIAILQDEIIGDKTGNWKTYYENGQLESIGDYYGRGGMKDGIWRNYYDDGKLKSESVWKRETRHTNRPQRIQTPHELILRKEWDERGQLRVEHEYKDGDIISGKEWDENGSLLAKKDYKLINLIKKHNEEIAQKKLKNPDDLPDWFDGNICEEGDTITSYLGKECKLSAQELSMYDYIMGAKTALEIGSFGGEINTSLASQNLRKGLMWFRENNPQLYEILYSDSN
jgi:antitoxin component YwqK of YwqJK toxin-antitoxin module